MSSLPPDSDSPRRTAMLVSVGGAPEPVLATVQHHRKDCVWFFCSPETRTKAEEMARQLDWRPHAAYCETEDAQSLAASYRVLRDRIPSLLHEWNVDPAHVVVDFTGGTKPMSAALALAAVEQFGTLSYVGGEKREKDGQGIVVSGTERVIHQDNPWMVFGTREAERICWLWNRFCFEEAADAIKALAQRSRRPFRLGVLADLAKSLAARQRFDFKSASSLAQRTMQVRNAFEGHNAAPTLLALVERNAQINDACRTNIDCPQDPAALLRELLDNALRCAEQGRFDDATSRLYRSLELQVQIWLQDATQGAFVFGKLREDSPLPAALAHLPYCTAPDDAGELKLSLEQGVRALATLGHARAIQLSADIDLGGSSEWRRGTSVRNASLLAHGITRVSRDDWMKLCEMASKWLGFDLSREHNPMPKFDPAWLEA